MTFIREWQKNNFKIKEIYQKREPKAEFAFGFLLILFYIYFFHAILFLTTCCTSKATLFSDSFYSKYCNDLVLSVRKLWQFFRNDCNISRKMVKYYYYGLYTNVNY